MALYKVAPLPDGGAKIDAYTLGFIAGLLTRVKPIFNDPNVSQAEAAFWGAMIRPALPPTDSPRYKDLIVPAQCGHNVRIQTKYQTLKKPRVKKIVDGINRDPFRCKVCGKETKLTSTTYRSIPRGARYEH